ncbi:hypothetical protein FXE63_13830 [Vibrio mimicus]|uniref:hypothetical protein n=1 Tax=Vibrio mimicus TaxID=674 RepID=UPI0011D9E6B9|nr:hypothetical protein [Vibrio mimicus]TXZ07024.1 hypothetical protein FXE63_13830 [Vibrio mimicus]
MEVVFLGPDGSGKSTVINAVQERLKLYGIGYSYHYLVPGYMPRYKDVNNGVPNTNPHGKMKHGVCKSLVKLVYWFLEYRLGINRLQKSNKVRLFDRYFYDILVDPSRYCYGASPICSRIVAKLIPKPKLLVIVDAPTDVIQQRKQEVSWQETDRQRSRYLSLEGKYCRTIVIDTTLDIQLNVDKIIEEIS